MEQLLRNRWLVCRRADRIAVRRSDARRPKAHTTCRGGWRRICDADDHPFRSSALAAALINIPWQGIGIVSVVWALVGLSGIVYAVVVARRMRVQTVYTPVFYDWMF